ncbi:hypothetical protein F4818DRAFT_438747 [Hypoxylon cercidicola]|nr:hypothetical protein F4818DRAFT_438747 [Hypoxylon cercidicola]
MALTRQQAKPEYHGLEGNFLDLARMRKLPVTNEERQFRIIRRCNWYMFCSSQCRGFLAKYHSTYPEGSRSELMNRDTVSIADIQNTLVESWDKWCNISTKAKRLEMAIDNIPNPERIKKVLCLGLGTILSPLPGLEAPESGPGNMISPRNIAQHLAAIATAKQLERKTGQQILLYTADPYYGPRHKLALETLLIGPFIVLDPSYGKHEAFTMIDDSTLLFDMAGPPQCPTMRIIQEYARPVAIITREIPLEGKFQDRLWFDVTEEDGTKVQVPGCADLPFPDGCSTFGGLCPKRVRDMIADDYRLEDKFPVEEKQGILSWTESDLINYEDRGWSNTSAGGYWSPHTRFYVREDKADMPGTDTSGTDISATDMPVATRAYGKWGSMLRWLRYWLR